MGSFFETELLTLLTPWQYYLLSSYTQSSSLQSAFPASTNNSNYTWAVILRVQDSVGGEATMQTCNSPNFLCQVQVISNYTSPLGALSTLQSIQMISIEQSILMKDVLKSLSTILIVMNTLNNQQPTKDSQRRLAGFNMAGQDLLDFRCRTVAPLLNQSLPNNFFIQPNMQAIVNSTAQSLNALFAVPSQIDENCLNILDSILDRIFSFEFFEFQSSQQIEDENMLQDLTIVLNNAVASILLMNNIGNISGLMGYVLQILSYQRLISELLVLGIQVGEIEQSLNGITSSALASRLECRTYTAGYTIIPPFSATFANVHVTIPENKFGIRISNLPCSRGTSGELLCQSVPSVVASVDVFYQNPFFFDRRNLEIISNIAWPKLMVYGVPEWITLDGLANSTILNFLLLYSAIQPSLQLVPNAARNAKGQFRIAACVQWNSTDWSTTGCLQTRQYLLNGATWVECSCNITSFHTVVDALAGCDGVAFSNLILDRCRVCGGDNSSCRGCDGVVASGKVLDGCNICGGDNSSCSGCDGIPNSGSVYDFCGVCKGDNSTCSGCDGIPVNPNTQARMKVYPKQYDACGVCGGCNVSCAGCDGVPNSHKEFDLCHRCGPFNNPNQGQYSLLSINNCTAGNQPCAEPGQAMDACGICISIQDTSNMNTECMGCDHIPAVFGRKSLDKCKVCGGNDCSCKDCANVTNGPSKLDRCGICNGNNSCLDCFGVPYGPAKSDICNICNGKNLSSECRGCDNKLYPRPLQVPILDSEFICCLGKIGCNKLCNASVGCDGKCSKHPVRLDGCGVCGGTNQPNTGTCDCSGTTPYYNMSAAIGCDGICKYKPTEVDTCGICGGNNLPNTVRSLNDEFDFLFRIYRFTFLNISS